MLNTVDKQQQTSKIAKDVLELSRNMLLVNLRFLNESLFRLNLMESCFTYATDGEHLFYEPKHVLAQYVDDRGEVMRSYLHIVLHCIFRHSFINILLDTDIWDIAADIACENVLLSLNLSWTKTIPKKNRENVINDLKNNVKSLTAEKIYSYYFNKGISQNEKDELRNIFLVDNHSLWYKRSTYDGNSQGDTETQENDVSSEKQDETIFNEAASKTQLEQDWKEISERIQTGMDTLLKSQGSEVGNMAQQLEQLNRERYDYTYFLKKFAVMGEQMKINDDEFDYVFYTYGLELFGNMPLIEPLEYKEIKRIREFVIAIDTSGSVSGELVQIFLQKTYNILKSTENFFSKINIHIIQCDTDIQEDVKVTSQDEFDEYLKKMTIKGLGGTDFRPVFTYVDNLIANHEFINLKGLVYFTDGYGTFPATRPQYETAFVFIQDTYAPVVVPPWGMKVTLEKEEL